MRVQQPDNWPQFQITVDRFKAAEMGLTEQNVANSVLLGLSGSSQVQPAYWLDPKVGIQYLINVRAPEYRHGLAGATQSHAHQLQPARC